jgi:hypothetical protein
MGNNLRKTDLGNLLHFGKKVDLLLIINCPKVGCFCVTFFCSTEARTQGLHLESLHQPYFCEGFFEIGSHELFAQAGFEPLSFWSLPPSFLYPMELISIDTNQSFSCATFYAGCLQAVRKLLWGWENWGVAQLWLWWRWGSGETSPPTYTASSLIVGSNRPYSSLLPLCIILSAYIEFSVFILASSSSSLLLIFFSCFWCQDIYSFLLYGSHTIYIPSWAFQR